jgi:tape measure domain-containing protein
MAVIKFEGDASGAIRAINQIESALGGIQKSVASASNGMRGLQTAITGIMGAAAGGSLFSFVDSLQNMENRLRVATGSTQEFNQANTMVKMIADRTGQSLVETGNLYASLSQNAKKLGYSQDQVATATLSMNTALQASGVGAQQAQSVLLQFSQILAKGKVNGDEFTTIIENLGGPVLDTIAKNMGITTEQLIKFKEKGLVAGKDFTDALIRSLGELDGMTGKTTATLGQSLQRIQNAFGEALLKIDQATGFSQAFADVMKKISDNGENLIPIIKLLGATLAGLLIYFAPIASGFAAVAGLALYFADVLGPIVKPVVDAVEGAISGLIKTVIGLGAAMKAAANFDNPFTAYSDAIDEYEKKAKKATEKPPLPPVLATAVANAGTETGAAGQMKGVSDKYKEILKDIQMEAKLTAETNAEYQIKTKILGINKQLEYQMGEAQKSQLETLLLTVEQNKAMMDLKEGLKKSQIELNALNTTDLDQRQIDVALATEKLRLGKAYTEEMGRIITETVRNNQLQRESLALSEQQNLLAGKVTPMNREQGIQKATQVISEEDPRLAMTQDYATKKAAIDAAIATSEQTLNGVMTDNHSKMILAKENLETLYRNNKELADIEYNNRELLRATEHTDALMALNDKVFQAKKMAEIQSQTGSQFGYDTQKQMAKEAADFQKKSDLEKAQFGIEQAASVFSSLGQQNKKAFEASKAMNVAMAIMNTYMAATKALATYPWPFGMLAAAAAVAAGFAQVNAIKSQQYSGRATGGPMLGNQPYLVGENGPEIVTPRTASTVTPNRDIMGGGGNVNVNFTIVANDTAGFDQLLTQRKGLITQIIRDAQLDRGVKGSF